jgi:maltokinase
MATELESLQEYLLTARWFGGKGRDARVTGFRRLGEVGSPETEPRVAVTLAEVTYDDAEGGTDLYQVPLALYAEPEGRLDHAFVGWWKEGDDEGSGWVHAYDAVHDRAAMAKYLETFLGKATTDGDLRFVSVGGHELEPDAQSTLFSGEQSNSSVAYGEDAVLKVFRKITPGENPDITTHRVLTEAESTHVAHLYGWVESGAGDDVLHLAMLQQFLRTASDGWDIAVASVRDLFAEADLHAEEVGGDFAGEAARLGEALCEVHEQLKESFPSGTAPAAEVADAMNARLAAAIDVVPQLDEHAERLQRTFAQLAELGELPVQRVHGDLHLGQTLRTVAGWKLVDFEGEPAKPLAERLHPDSPWRDVAGMLRSFDYAPFAVAESSPEDDPDVVEQRRRRAEEWAARNKQAFLRAYTGTDDLSHDQGVLVAAYVAEKAIYECVYEARNRPTWLPIPLAAIARMGVP